MLTYKGENVINITVFLLIMIMHINTLLNVHVVKPNVLVIDIESHSGIIYNVDRCVHKTQ